MTCYREICILEGLNVPPLDDPPLYGIFLALGMRDTRPDWIPGSDRSDNKGHVVPHEEHPSSDVLHRPVHVHRLVERSRFQRIGFDRYTSLEFSYCYQFWF